jgi:hypothetical protein
MPHNVSGLCDGRAFNNKKMKMSTQVDLFTTVEPTSVSPAIAKPFVMRMWRLIKR